MGGIEQGKRDKGSEVIPDRRLQLHPQGRTEHLLNDHPVDTGGTLDLFGMCHQPTAQSRCVVSDGIETMRRPWSNPLHCRRFSTTLQSSGASNDRSGMRACLMSSKPSLADSIASEYKLPLRMLREILLKYGLE